MTASGVDWLQGYKTQLLHFTAWIHWLLRAQEYQSYFCKLLHKRIFLCVAGILAPFSETAPSVWYRTVGHSITQASLSKLFKGGQQWGRTGATLVDTSRSLQGIHPEHEFGADGSASKYHPQIWQNKGRNNNLFSESCLSGLPGRESWTDARQIWCIRNMLCSHNYMGFMHL